MLNYFKKENTMSKKWGFIRETKEKAIKAGIDKDGKFTHICPLPSTLK
jgi:hypothetical protein